MKDRYDFSKGRPNPYAKLLKKPVTIRLDTTTVDYFKALAEESEIPYQTLISSVLHKYVTGRLTERPVPGDPSAATEGRH